MRIAWIRLRHFRGIEERRLDLPASGVTIVEGPNETGKSSFAQALDMLFHELDSTRKQALLQVRPVHLDVPTEVEAEVETGPYRFTYRKRFFRQPETVLTVHAPRPRTLVGREAHQRALAILDETIDRELWKALCVQQGEAVGQAPLGHAKSLGQALDVAAGHETAGERELDLFAAAEAEYRRWFTPERGDLRKEHRAAAAHAEALGERVAALEDELARLERDIERHAQLEREILDLDKARREAQAAVAGVEAQLKELEVRERAAEVVQLKLKGAQASESVARKDLQARRDLVRRADDAALHRVELEARAAREEPALQEAVQQAEQARRDLALAEERAKRAEETGELRERDLDYQHARLDLEQLRERQARLQKARAGEEAAAADLERIRVDAPLLARLRAAHLALAQAEATLEARSARLKVRALGPLAAELDGKPLPLAEGEAVERAVADEARLLLPGVAEITVAAGARELAAARDKALRAWQALLGEAGVLDLTEAERSLARREAAERVRDESERIREENLRDLTPQLMEQKIERLRAWVDAYPSERPAAPPLAPDFDAANDAKNAAKDALKTATAGLEEARTWCTRAQAREAEAKERARETTIGLRHATEAEAKVQAELQAARAKGPDAALEHKLEKAAAEVNKAQLACDLERRALAAVHPDQLRRGASEARQAAADAAARLRNAQDEWHGVQARLELLNERGLFEELEDARGRRRHAEDAARTVERRAAAAALLYKTLARRREEARRAYAAPLRRQIEALGRTVFGADLAVELGPQLGIATRTLDGKTLPFDSLSVGAREQLSLLARVACAMLVDEERGVPLLFDDTLGHADPERLQAMGAVLQQAAECCQLIVLTCTPDRFRSVEGAHRIRLAAPAPAPDFLPR